MKRLRSNIPSRIIVFFVLGISFPLSVLAQSEIESALAQNASLVESLSLLSPMAISPFWTLFITSFASTFNIGNDYIASNPMLDSVLVLSFSFLLVVITTLPNLMKVSKPIGLAAKFLENKAGYVIYILMMIVPYIFVSDVSQYQGMITFGIFGIPFKVLLIIALALPYFIVVMTVRYFLEIMVFLSPIPLFDAVLEILKKLFTVSLIVIYFLFPTFGFILSLLIFFVALLFFKKAKKLSNFFQYIYALPILYKLFNRQKELVSEKLPSRIKKKFPNASVAVKCLTTKKIGNIPSKSIAWLVKHDVDVYICQPKSLRPPTIVRLSDYQTSQLQLSEDLYYQIIHDQQFQVKILLSNAYQGLSADLIHLLNLEVIGKIGLARRRAQLTEQGRRGFRSIMSTFNSGQMSAGRDVIFED